MTRGKRFFIFFSSAGIMTAFLLFTLSVREDKPLETYMAWTPNNKVISMITERITAQNKVYPKRIDFVDSAVTALDELELTKLEVLHALKDGNVEFSHDLSEPRSNPKKYYILLEINDQDYYVVVRVLTGYSEIFMLGKVEET